MHHATSGREGKRLGELSIPFTWDFSMHLLGKELDELRMQYTFNSLYLGFFHAPVEVFGASVSSEDSFQFPLLGIFPCTRADFGLIRRFEVASNMRLDM